MRRSLLIGCVMAVLVWTVSVARAQTLGRVVLVMPFENRSGNASLNWIGESLPDTLNRRLSDAGYLTISHDDRVNAFDHLGLPVTFRPSRSTTLKIAQQMDANVIVLGSFSVTEVPAGSQTTEKITIQTSVLSVDALRLTQLADESAPIEDIVRAENAVAWKVARQIDPAFSVSEQGFLDATNGVSLTAFENYIRGTTSGNPAEREKRLEIAVNAAPTYAAALLALGKEQYTALQFDAAARTLAKVPPYDPLGLEAGFYLGLAKFAANDYTGAEQAFHAVGARLALAEVVNDEAVAAARQKHDAVAGFEHAVAIDPADGDYHYNLAVALMRRGDTQRARAEAEAAAKIAPADAEIAALRTQLTKGGAATEFAERFRKNYSEASYRQAAFLMSQMQAAKLSGLSPLERAAAYVKQGDSFYSQGLMADAQAQYRDALSAMPGMPSARIGIARVHIAQKQTGDARKELVSVNTQTPTVEGFLALANLEFAEKHYEACDNAVEKALKLEPGNATAKALKLELVRLGQPVQ